MRTVLQALSVALIAVWPVVAFAEDAAPKPDHAALTNQAWQAAVKVATRGPSDVAVADQATLHVPQGMAFIPRQQANDLLVSWGNTSDKQLFGLVLPTDDQTWAITIDQVAEGHVSDEDAKKWNAEDLLKSIREGTEADNEDRVKRGFPEMEILGWQQAPLYDSTAHKLVWALQSQDKGAGPADVKGVNYNTYALGREGYFKLDLLTDDKNFEHDKPLGQKVLAAFEYNNGKRYEDFNAGTDRLAEYGIAALIGGVAAKKLGLLALVGVFVAKFIKVIAVGAVVALGGLRRLFTRRKTPGA